MEEKLTIKQVLMITRDMLRSIGSVPLEESERIGVPIIHAIRNLEECINAISADERRAEEEHAEVQEETNENADV